MARAEREEQRKARMRATRDRLHEKPLVSRNPIWRFCQFIFYYCIIIPLLKVGVTLWFGLKLENRAVFRSLKGQGYVVTSNHIHPMDCTMIGLSIFPRHAIYTSQEETFYVRGLGLLLKLLNCIPILSGMQGLRIFLDTMEAELKRGKVVVVYPEGEIGLLCDHLRKFRDGAFTLATRANVPIVPVILTPRESRGIWKLFRREYCLTLTAGEPIMPVEAESQKKAVVQLREQTFEAMAKLQAEGGHAYPKNGPSGENAFWQVKKSKDI